MSQKISTPTVSVVMGVYNAERWLRDALDSVLAQTHRVDEVIVIDDGSTDSTPAIAASYGEIVKYAREEHRGRPRRNRGIIEARGDYVAFIDGDDYWHPQKLELQISMLGTTGRSWAICEADWVDAETRKSVKVSSAPVQDGDILQSLILNNFIVASTVVVAKPVFEEVGTFDEGPDIAAVEDWDLWLRIAGRHRVACVHQKLCTLRLHGDSFLAALPAARRVDHLENVIERAVGRHPERLEALRGKAIANVSYAAGVEAFRRLRLSDARQHFIRTLRHQPTNLNALGYVCLSFLGIKIVGLIMRLRISARHGRQ